MSLRLAVINASPVTASSTAALLRAATAPLELTVRGTGREIVTEMFDLNQTSQPVIPCQSCGKAPEQEWCFYHDPLTPVLEAIAQADALLIGSPIHFDAVSAQAKLLIDRCNCFRPPDFAGSQADYRFIKRLTHKRPGGMVLVGGPDAWFEGARRCLAGWFKWIEVENCGLVTFHSADYSRSGLAIHDADANRRAAELGEGIALKLIADLGKPAPTNDSVRQG